MPSPRPANPSEMLRRRYVRDQKRQDSLQDARLNTEVAQTLLRIRQEEGLTQQQLAQKVGTTQSVISRLEDADYEGHSLTMLNRIAKSLNRQVRISIESPQPRLDMIRLAFQEVLRHLRRTKGLSVEEFAQKLNLPLEDVLAMERDAGYRPSPLILHRLSKFYGIPQRRLAILAGAINEVPDDVREHASRFAAKSESFSRLDDKEKRIVDEFVSFLRSET